MQHRHRVVLVAFSLLWTVQASVAQERAYGPGREFGLGVIIGEPAGISAKLWTSGTTAFDAGMGWSLDGDRVGNYRGSYIGGDRIHLHFDHLWHEMDAIPSTERFPVYYGIGAGFNSGGGYGNTLAVRGVLGVAWLPRGTPIDVFLELAPALQITPFTGFGVGLSLGARYFF